MRYLVGTDNNTWRLPDAIQAAAAGDTIEFQAGYSPVVDGIAISKDLHFEGKVTLAEGGNQNFTNVITGKFNINQQANVTFENIWICYGVERTNIINCKEQAEVSLINCVLENSQTDGEVYPLIYAENESKVVLKNTTIMENPKLYIKSYIENSKLELDNCVFQDCKLIIDNVDFKVNNSTLQTGDGNAINAAGCNVEIVNSTIKGCDKDKEYPAVWLDKSTASIVSSRILQPGFSAAICVKSGSGLHSEGNEFTSIKVEDAKATFKDTVIREGAMIQDESAACILGEWNILGESEDKIDLGIMNRSVVYGDTLTLNHVNSPNIRMTEDSIFSVKELKHNGGEVSELNIEAEEGCKTYYPKNGRASGNAGNGSEDSDKPQVSAREQLNQLIGLGSVKKEIDKMLRMVEFNQQRIAKGLEPQEQSYHSVFLGNPGTGKTTVARLIGEVLFESGAFKSDEFKLIEASEPDFISQNVGGTAQQTLALLEKAKGGVLFIDEAYALNKKDANVDFGIEAINTILKYMEDHRGEIMIIFAGYTKEMEEFLKTNPGLTSRVPNKFVFEDYTPDEIVEIGEKDLVKKQYQFEDEEYYAQQVKRAYRNSLDHSNARWIRNFNEKLLKAFANRVMNTGTEDLETITRADIDEVLAQGRYQASGKKDEDALERLQKLIGINGVKEQVNRFISLVELNHRREEQGMENSDFTLHSLFLGNPGTGKTTVARIVGEVLYQKGIISQKKFIEVSRSDLVAGYIGQTAKKTREVLESALGGVLFIDEAYSLSQGSENDFGKEAIDEILKFMEDHRKDMVIIFAGYTKEMSAFLQMNPGLASRIPHTFDFEDYTPDEIVKIGLLGLHNAAYEVDEAAYADLVKNNYSLTSDHSNGRWVRNLNEELIMVMSERVAHAEDADINQILQEDLDAVRAGNHGMRTLKSTEESTEKVVADENGYAVPPGSN
mgnify:FL=1